MTVLDLADRTPAQKQGLLSQLVVPRPIAMISTVDAQGRVNVAPYSYYMPVCGEPPTIAVTVGVSREATDAPKDTWVNIERSGEFVVNVTGPAMAEHIETAAQEFPPGANEAEAIGWSTVPSHLVAPPSLVPSPAHLECRVLNVIDHGDPTRPFSAVHIVIAEVVCIDVADDLLTGPARLDPTRLEPVGRMGFPWFVNAARSAMFEQDRIPYGG